MYVCLLAKTRKPLDQFRFNSQGNFIAQGRFVSIYKRIAKFCKEVWPLKNNAPVIVFGFYLYPKVGIICVCVYKCLYLVNGLADKFKSLWDCFVFTPMQVSVYFTESFSSFQKINEPNNKNTPSQNKSFLILKSNPVSFWFIIDKDYLLKNIIHYD